MRILTTGGAGFLGSHLVDELIKIGHEVLVVDNLSTGSYSNISKHENSLKFFFEEKSIQALGMYDIFKEFKPQVVFHLAARPNVNYSVDNPAKTNEYNVQGLVNILELSAKNKVDKFIFSSSSSVYGQNITIPTTELTELNPCSPYALQKKIGEEYCKLFSREYGLDTIVLRFFNVFGPRQNLDSGYGAVIPSFFDSIKKNIPPKIYGDGEQFRDFSYIDNIIQALLLTLKVKQKLNGEVFNIGYGEKTTVNELSKIMKTLPPIYLKERAGDIKHSLADITKAKKILGYHPQVSLIDGLRLISTNL